MSYIGLLGAIIVLLFILKLAEGMLKLLLIVVLALVIVGLFASTGGNVGTSI